jgi:hypothetical protein
VTLRRYQLARRVARRLGYHLVKANYYSPIPDVDRLPGELWEQAEAMPGLDWDLDRQLSFVEESLGEHLRRFQPPAGYTATNPFFSPVDAEFLDAMLRWSGPSQVVELGSGFSSLLIAAARSDGSTHRIIDPFPSGQLVHAARQPTIAEISTADAPWDWFGSLGQGDVLFADTTHTVKLGGDVPRLILDVLPRLASGVVVHIHDFFRPFPYPRVLYEQFGVYWQEQELVQALLCETDTWRILCASHGLWRLRRDRIQELVPAAFEGIAPSSLWLQRN